MIVSAGYLSSIRAPSFQSIHETAVIGLSSRAKNFCRHELISPKQGARASANGKHQNQAPAEPVPVAMHMTSVL